MAISALKGLSVLGKVAVGANYANELNKNRGNIASGVSMLAGSAVNAGTNTVSAGVNAGVNAISNMTQELMPMLFIGAGSVLLIMLIAR